jgi:VanZ family protein
MSIIFYFSTRSTTGFGGTNETRRFLILKSFHLIEYAFLAFLLSFAILKKKLVIIIAYLYAISDEIHQSFTPGRTPRFQDTLIDLIGILIGLFIFNKIFSFKKIKNNLY